MVTYKFTNLRGYILNHHNTIAKLFKKYFLTLTTHLFTPRAKRRQYIFRWNKKNRQTNRQIFVTVNFWGSSYARLCCELFYVMFLVEKITLKMFTYMTHAYIFIRTPFARYVYTPMPTRCTHTYARVSKWASPRRHVPLIASLSACLLHHIHLTN